MKSTLVTDCDENISVMDILSAKKTNITSTTSINCHSIKVRDCYFYFILLVITIIICYHYTKQKGITLNGNLMNWKQFQLKIIRVIISMI